MVAYNVQARPWFDDSVHKFTRMPKVLEPFDIISFQEMFKDHARMYAGLSHPVKVYHAAIQHPFKIVGSGLGTVSRFPLAADGDLGAKEVVCSFGHGQFPDGLAFDVDGNVWIAFWGGSCIRQFTPQGALLRTIALPAPQITSMAFGGDNLDLLLVTSARVGLDDATLERYPLAGSIFVLEPGVQGVLPCTFG